ncbi:MAG TPA: aminotransferase class I/II-fold pyridoxal phosphate-dependent enzyme [Thermoanaerobaculia bacterium]|nr:aminotransferase class I/II-fold pyridoxal phosphate-dependent enzyme [Thermoanaerobaculia bacterium]
MSPSDDPTREINREIARHAPAVWTLLSELGRQSVYPPDIPFQAAQARGKRFNATIGQITDGHGRVLAPPSLERQLAGLEGDRNAALLYSPMEGREELRRRWRERHRPRSAAGAPSSLPLVVAGLTHGLALVADLFCDRGRAVVVPAPFWGNYRQIFGLRRGGRMVPAELYRSGRFDPAALRATLDALPAGEPAIVLLNLPANPVGYSPTAPEADRLVEALVAAAARRPLLVVCDDAYAGLVYEDGVPAESLFWRLSTVDQRLVAVKIDGSTKELVFFGGRVAFLTFPFDPDSAVTRALESKAKCLLRATIGSPVAVSQEIALAALQSESVEEEIVEVRRVLAGRYRALRRALERVDSALLRALPFNSGCFALLELPADLSAETVRQRLLAELDTGVVSIAPRYLRIAYCSVGEEAIPELVERIEAGARAEWDRVQASSA